MTDLTKMLRDELATIDRDLEAAQQRRAAIVVLIGEPLPAPTFTAASAAAQPVQPKARKPKAPKQPADDRDWRRMTPEERAEPIVKTAKRNARPSLRSKISATTIRKVRKDKAAGKSIKELCAIHDLKPSTTSNIINRKGWFSTVD